MARGVRSGLFAIVLVGSLSGAALPLSAAEPPIAFAPIGTYSTGLAVGGTAAEIVAVDDDRMFVSNASDVSIDIVDISDPSAPTLITRVPLAAFGGGVNSVAVHRGVVAVAVEADVKTDPGTIVFLDRAGTVIGQATVGALPDMVTFTKNGKSVIVANEGEPNSYGQPDSVDPVGSISIVDVHAHTKKNPKPKARDNVTIGFADFNVGGHRHAELPADVRIYGPGAGVAQDLEPEYITVSDDGKTAWVTLQENNALAIIDLHRQRVDAIVALGRKDHGQPGNGLDASDRDGPGPAPAVNIANWPVSGLYEPDAIANLKIKGHTYLFTANEGDLRKYTGYVEEARVGAISYVLDPAVFPDPTLKSSNDKLNRLTVSTASGNLDADAQFERIDVPGARSFSIWTESGELLWDSGDQLERIVAAANPAFFNSTNSADEFDTRSDDKGPEPEAITVGEIDGRTYAFVGLERQGGIVIFDVTDPTAPTFVQYVNNRVFDTSAVTPVGPDSGPEHIEFVEARDSPTGKALLVVSNEFTGTVTVYQPMS